MSSIRAAEVRSERPAKKPLDPWRPIGTLVEEERLSSGQRVPSLTVFLTGSECPWACVFCDLWRYTLDEKTPPGALPAQLREAYASVEFDPAGSQVKLYNASNFFDPKAVPKEDDAELAALTKTCAEVVVECHPKLVGDRCFRFAEQLDGRLQIAMGLETIHPQIQPRLGKGADLDDYARACERLREHGIGWRAFVLVGLPFAHEYQADAVTYAYETARWAVEHGAGHVALIPLRPSELDRLGISGQPPSLDQIEVLHGAFSFWLRSNPQYKTVLSVDLWDLENFAPCQTCFEQRRQRLLDMSLTDQRIPLVVCPQCDPDGDRSPRTRSGENG